MDPFTQRMLERARIRREKLDQHKLESQLSDVDVRPKLPLQSNTSSNIEIGRANNAYIEKSDDALKRKSDLETQCMTDTGKSKLQRLAQLYTDNAEPLSSPVHRAEEALLDDSEICTRKYKLGRLAELATKINEWEDDLNHPKKNANKAENFKNIKTSTVTIKSKSVTSTNQLDQTQKGVLWDRDIIKTLESQGFSRSQSQSKLIYNFESERAKKENSPSPCKSPRTSTSKPPRSPYNKISPKKSSDVKPQRNELSGYRSPGNSPRMGIGALKDTAVLKKAAMFESNIKSSPSKLNKDPAELSLAERKALFEKNKGEAILPKVAFATSLPAKMRTEGPKSPVKKISLENNIGVVKRITSVKTNHNKEGASRSTATINNSDIIAPKIEKTFSLENKNNFAQEKTMNAKVLNAETHSKKFDTVRDTNSESSPVPKPPPMPVVYNDSPETLRAVKEVKPIHVSPVKDGKLYPSLSDIYNSEGSERNSSDESFNESKNSDIYLNMSFGDIIEATKNNPLTPPSDQSFSKSKECQILSKMDELLEEALGDISSNYDDEEDEDGDDDEDNDNDPQSPPKMSKSTSFEYKHNSNPVPTTPLMHTVSFYRKQQQNSAMLSTPATLIKREEKSPEKVEEDESSLVEEKIQELLKEINKQQTIISQASQALNLCLSTVEFSGSGEQVEGERLLLLASHKRQACLNEIQRLKVENSLRPHGSNSQITDRGDVTITNITIPLKREAVRSMATDESMLYLVCLIKSDEKVLATPAISATREHLNNLALRIPGQLKLDKLLSDFKVTVEVYNLALSKEMLPHEVKYHISNKKEKKLLTPIKSKKNDSKLVMPCVQSPAGPNAVRTSNFQMCGYIVFSLREVTRSQWTLNKVPYTSPLEGSISMKIQSDLQLDDEYRGFLTMFDDISGFGAWHRRWCLLSSHTLSYWKYPDDENKKIPIGTIDLRSVITENVGLVSRDICARLHTFLLETTRSRQENDKDSLVLNVQGDKTKIRHLLSADGKQEMLVWCRKLNTTLALLRAWRCNVAS